MMWTFVMFVSEFSLVVPFVGGLPTITSLCFGEAFSTFLCLMLALGFALLVAQNVIALSEMTLEIFHGDSIVSVVLWLFFYTTIFFINKNQRFFFKIMTLLTLYSIVVFIVVLYIASTACYTKQTFYFENGFLSPVPVSLDGFTKSLPSSIWAYLGIEAVSLTSEEVIKFNKNCVKNTFFAMLTITMLVIVLLFIGPLLSDLKHLLHTEHPLLEAIEHIFDIDHESPIFKILLLFTVMPVVMVSTLAGVYVTSRKVYSLARIGLIFRQLSITRDGSPIFAIMASCVFSFVVTLAVKIFKVFSGASAEFITNAFLMIPAWTSMVSYFCFCVTLLRARKKLNFLVLSFFSVLCCCISMVCTGITIVLFLINDIKFYGACLGLTAALGLVIYLFEVSRKHELGMSACRLFIEHKRKHLD